MRFIALVFIQLLLASQVYAHEIISIVTSDCHLYSGFVVSADSEQVKILNFEGQQSQISRAKIHELFIHNVLVNPIKAKIKTNQNDPLFKITVENENQKKTSFYAWITGFIDDLVFLLNTNGQVEVIEIHKIMNLENAGPQSIEYSGKNPDLQYSTTTSCQIKTVEKGSIPSRILSEQIQIQEFLSNFEAGYTKVESLQERMLFYAKPYLFQNTFRFGFTSALNPDSPEYFPLYFKWSNGEPFGLQSSQIIGGHPSEWLPSLYPQFIIQSEIKSHLFHGLVTAHLPSLAPGVRYFESSMYTSSNDTNIGSNSEKMSLLKSSDEIVSGLSWNYLALFGLDYKSLSVSFGGFFPIVYMFELGNVREVLSKKPNPIVRLILNYDRFKIRAIASELRYSDKPTNSDFILSRELGNKIQLDQYDLNGLFYRFGVDVFSVEKFILSVDYSYFLSEYKEVFGNYSNYFNMKRETFLFSVSRDFSRYVALKIFLAMPKISNSASFANVYRENQLQTSEIGGQFEFIF